MAGAFFWGLVAASSLVVGGLLASWVTIGKRTLGLIMGFGAGVLVSAIAYELVYEAVHIAKLTGFPALGFFTRPLNPQWSFRSSWESFSTASPSPS
jgi:ZIP family zinc transporter